MTIAPGAIATPPPDDDLVLRLAAAAYLGRYVGASRIHTESDLRLFLAWCADQGISPLVIQRAQIERYVRWMQEVRRFKPSTVSRRMAVVTGFYRTCVIDAVLEHRAVDDRIAGAILLNRRGRRMDRHCATRRLRRLAESSVVRLPRMHPHMLRHTFVTTMLDAGVDLRDVQIAARHADPRTTMRYDRARKNLDRHPNYILAAYMASAT
jgi:site-specific recombinase XerD